MPVSDIVDSIRSSLSSPSPYSSGTCSIPLTQFTLFYDVDGSNVSKINLAKATKEELERLTNACQPATFGVNNEDVHDESYRKAGKMDFGNFATSLDVIGIGLIDAVRGELLDGEDDAREIKVEMYKLNVYGKDSFFKPHKDTPRDKTMFGSLVVVFPTPHEGGEFVLRHDNKECVIDFSKTISEAGQQPCVGYVAFFSDVEHEVLKVRFGHRVTLTYNLYFPNKSHCPTPSISTPAVHETFLTESLYALMCDPTVLPDGGYLGFGLRHEYPVEEGMHVTDLRPCLKGADAMLGRILSALGVVWDIRVYYAKTAISGCYLSKCFISLPKNRAIDDEWIFCLMIDDEQGGPKFVEKANLTGQRENKYDEGDGRPLAEVTKMDSMTRFESTFLAYGNEPSIEWLYGHVCIIVDLPKLTERAVRQPTF